jgi:hypothetical protein
MGEGQSAGNPSPPLKPEPRVCIRTPPICDQVFTLFLSLGYITNTNCDYHRLGGGEGGRAGQLEEDWD